MSDRCRAVIAAAVIFAAAAFVGAAAKAFVVGETDVAFAAPTDRLSGQPGVALAYHSAAAGPVVNVRHETIGGRDVATIYVNGVPVMRMRAKYGRWSPYERARIVSDRLQPLIGAGLRPGEVRSAQVRGSYVVQARGVDLVTVMPFDANLVGSSRADLADTWAENLRAALGGSRTDTGGVGARPRPPAQRDDAYSGWPSTPSAEWRAPEPYGDRWVPIVSILSGLKLGVARVNGPLSRLQYVQAVAQLETHWKDIVEIDVFVPISTKVPGKTLDRVEGCAITGFVDYDF